MNTIKNPNNKVHFLDTAHSVKAFLRTFAAQSNDLNIDESDDYFTAKFFCGDMPIEKDEITILVFNDHISVYSEPYYFSDQEIKQDEDSKSDIFGDAIGSAFRSMISGTIFKKHYCESWSDFEASSDTSIRLNEYSTSEIIDSLKEILRYGVK